MEKCMKMGKKLFEESSDSEPEKQELKTNKEYAKSYNKFREKELLKKLKDRDQDDSGSSDSDDSGSSDEDVVIDRKFDEDFFKTLASLKSKNPTIYDKNARFFAKAGKSDEKSEEEEEANKRRKKEKALTIKDYERKVILEKGGKYEDDDSDQEMDDENERAHSPSYIEEQRKIRQQLKSIVNSDSEDEGFGGIFRKREKTKQEKEKEEKEFAEWLAGQEKDIGESAKVLNPLKEYWSSPSLSKQEQFLRDYILSNGYQNKDVDEIPTYEEIVRDDISDDEKELEKQAEFEEKFNFRFEDPDREFIKRYPRTIDSSVRQKDDRRKQKREDVKQRKLKEKEQNMQELQMLKELKRKEIQEKIEKLKEVTGNEELAFREEELEDDFDPEAHDRRMQAIFNDEYYGVDEGEEKPECPDIEELKVEDWDNYDPAKEVNVDEYYEPHCEDDDFNMDCDYDPEQAKQSLQDELIESTKSKKKRKRKNQFMEMIKVEKPPFDPEDERTYAEYIDEYYKMDYEDMIGDQPCRFKYVETLPNDFGLTLEEILLAKNKELNQWCSLKKAVQNRPEHVELRDKKLYKMKAKNETLKRKIFVSLYGPPSEDESEENDTTDTKQSDKAQTETVVNGGTGKKKRKRKKKSTGEVTQTVSITKIEETQSKPSESGCHTVTKIIDLKKKTSNTFATEASTSDAIIEPKQNGSQTTKSALSKKNKKAHSQPEIKSKKSDFKQKNQNGVSQRKTDKPNRHRFEENKSKFKSKFRQQQQQSDDHVLNHISDERLRAYGLNPRKFRKQTEFKSRQNVSKNKNAKKNHKMKQQKDAVR